MSGIFWCKEKLFNDKPAIFKRKVERAKVMLQLLTTNIIQHQMSLLLIHYFVCSLIKKGFDIEFISE